MTTSSSSQKKKTQVIVDLIPNNYEEQPGEIEGKTRVFKGKSRSESRRFGQPRKVRYSFPVCADLGGHSRSRFIEDFQGNDDFLHRVEAFVFEIFGNEK